MRAEGEHGAALRLLGVRDAPPLEAMLRLVGRPGPAGLTALGFFVARLASHYSAGRDKYVAAKVGVPFLACVAPGYGVARAE